MIRSIILATAFLMLPSAAFSHHGFGSFDLAGEIRLQGTITDVDFVNPHAWVYLDVVNEDGQTEAWRCEMRAATVLRRSGWSKALFVKGAAIDITGSPDKNDSRSCYLSQVVFADGSSAERYGQLQESAPLQDLSQRELRLPNGDLNIAGDWAPEQFVMADARGLSEGLVPLSVAKGEVASGEATAPWPTSAVSYTPAGQLAADSFNMRSESNPRMRCATTSILFDWNFDGPINRITQTESTIVLNYGRYGFTRTIHLDSASHPDNLKLSRAGHSIGRWQGDVLIVDTIGFEAGVLVPPIMNSEQLHVIERFSLDSNNLVLNREYEATDPLIYTDQYIGSDTLNIADYVYSPDECKELSYIDFDQQTSVEEATAEKPWWNFWD